MTTEEKKKGETIVEWLKARRRFESEQRSSELCAERDEARKQLTTARIERDEARRERDRLRGVHFDKTQFEGQIVALTKERDRARDEVQSLNTAFGNLKYELEHTNDELDAERASHAETKKRLDAVPLSVIAANSQVASLYEEASVTRLERDAARKDLEVERGRTAAAMSLANDLQKKLNELSATLHTEREQNRALLAVTVEERQAARMERDAVRKELNAITSGMNWPQLAIDEERRHLRTREKLTYAEALLKRYASAQHEHDAVADAIEAHVVSVEKQQ